MRAAFRTAIETGDLTFACYSMYQSVTGLLLRNDPLDAVWRESEMALDFVRKAKFRDVADIIVSQQRFIATMQGRTATFSTFSDAQFDEATFEAQLTADRMPTMICFYWILKLKARFLSGDYAEALAAADKAKALLWAAAAQIQLLDYFYYTALTVAALYENASADEQNRWRELLTAHREQLREWAENYPPTFADKHALVSAEIARLEGRDARRHASVRAGHSIGSRERLRAERGRWPMRWPRGSTRRAASRRSPTPICGTHGTVISAGAPWARSGSSSSPTRTSARTPPRRLPPPLFGTPVEQLDLGDGGQGLASRFRRDRPRPAHRNPDDDRARTRRRRARPAHPPPGRRRRGSKRRPGPTAKTVEVTLRQETVTPAELPESLLHT